MNQQAFRILLGGVVLLLGGCSDDDGIDIRPKDPSAQAGSGGGGAGGAAGMGGSGGTSGAGGSGGGTSPPDAGPGDSCTPVFPDAGPLDAGPLDAGDAGLGDGGGGVARGAVSFAADIHPVLALRCGPCHVTDFSGGHNVASPDLDEAYGYARVLGQTILNRVNGGGMPPSETGCNGGVGTPDCVSVAEFELLRLWAAQCFPP